MVMKAAARAKKSVAVRTVAAGEFKAKCLQLLDEVRDGEVTVVVTKRGVPCATLVPYVEAEKPFRSVVGRTPGGRILGDIMSPLPEEYTLPGWALKKRKR